MKKITFLFFGLLLIIFSNAASAQSIVINELLASNTNSAQDENGSNEDWIELFNSGATTVNLLGYGITDDATLPFKWTFPAVSLAPGQYLMVWCSDKNRSVAGSPLHTNWKISASGETITLTNTSGVIVDTMPPANLQPDISYGRLPNGTGPFVFFGIPTPNAINATPGYSGYVSDPLFSQNSGFFATGFNLELSSTDAGTTILYTLDGSEPDENNLLGTTYNYKNKYPQSPGQAFGPFLSNRYQSFQYNNTPITISNRSSQPNDVSGISSTFAFNPTYLPATPVLKGTSVRVKVIKPGFLPSKIVTRNYFIFPEGSSKFSLPVVSLNVNEDDFFEYNNGIYVAGKDFDDWRTENPNGAANPSQAGNYYREDVEHMANFSYFVNGAEVVNQNVGLKIRGGVSRRFESKSLTVMARSDYGDDTMDYQFFSDMPSTAYERLTLSNSGGDFRSTMFRDPLNQNVCKELIPEKEAYQPVIAFLNGEYWGILNMRERFDDEYFKRVYDADAIDFLENNAEVKDGDRIHYQAMVNYLNTNSLAVPANYDYIKTQLVPDNVADYYIANIFFQNEDFPNNNQYFWRNKIAAYNPTAVPEQLDGRWRFMFHDMDNTFSFVSGDYTLNTLQTLTTIGTEDDLNPEWSTVVLRKLLVNPTFKNHFINRFADLLNTSFLSERIISKIQSMKAVIYGEIPGHIGRWKNPANIGDYNYDIEYEEEFANARPALQRNHIRSVFSIASNINATLNVSDVAQGFVKMNTIDVKDGTPGITGNPYPWTGIYFNNIPVTLKAVANPGFAFSHWTGASISTAAEITLTPTTDFSITAVFVPSGPVETVEPIYFWMMDGTIANNTPLTTLNSSFEVASNGTINYQSCLTGYPFPVGDPNRNKASMERRNSPTAINYRPEVNGNLAFAASDMKALQIKQPFQSGGLENTMVFNFSTAGYKKIKFSFAGLDEGAASAISIDYAVNAGTPVWITTGLSSISLPLSNVYQLFEVDFSSITAVDNNTNFRIRLRFTGPNMTADAGARVTFNNVAVDGVKLPLTYTTPNVFTIGAPIANLTPSVTETTNNYSVSPSLPAGLNIDAATGVISGTPTVATPTATYTVTATNTFGSISFGVVITVIAPPGETSVPIYFWMMNGAIPNDTPLSSLNSSYEVGSDAVLQFQSSFGAGYPFTLSDPNWRKGSMERRNKPTPINYRPEANGNAPYVAGDIKGLQITQPFQIGTLENTLIFNLSTSNYKKIKFSFAAMDESAATGITIDYAVNSGAPIWITTGLAVTSFALATNTFQLYESDFSAIAAVNNNPNFKIRLRFTGPDMTASAGARVTFNNIAVDGVKMPLSYPTPNFFNVGSAIANLTPSVVEAMDSYTVTPALPAGLAIDETTGIISGLPTAITPTGIYTVTATNSNGSISFPIEITINAAPPVGLTYISPNIFTRNTLIANLNPSISGGTVSSYSISPALPSGLSFDTATGIISGTPTIVTATATYTVTATNSGGSVSFGVVITVNDIAPNALAYASPNVFTVGSTITSLSPTASGNIITYSISPALPLGLSFDTATGIISGTPTAVASTATYTVTATNSGGNVSFGVVITVNDIAPNALAYASPNVFTVGSTITSLSPTVSGNVVSYTISPTLPSGLSFDTATGIISGTPTIVTATATYTVTATNSGGSVSFGVVITVNDVAPVSIVYNSPNVFTVGSTIASLSPTVSGNIITYSISPALPLGLSFDTATGIISGTPTIVTATTTYTVTATNSGGSVSFGVVITVNDIAPNALAYASPNVFTVGSIIASLSPTVSGNVVSYSISPTLPSGLSFDTATGIISGTPTIVTATATYTVTATNSGGSVSFGVVITVNDIAPNALAYASPNVFTVGSTIASLSPTVSGNVVSYSISPTLPSGLSFDTATGIISGTPTIVTATATYTVTATNSGGSVSFGVVITVNDIAPNALAYASPNVFTVGSTIASLSPTVSGNVVSYSISPTLPSGLSFDTATGIISGTPTIVTATTTYTVTATNSGGSVSFGVVITVNDIAPVSLSYNNPNVFITGTTITDLLPTINASNVTYSVSPNLPAGLILDAATGIISGTPTIATLTAIYTVTASNSGGNTSFGITITVEDPMATTENEYRNFKIYPNPFVDSIHVSGVTKDVSYKIYAADGKLIGEGKLVNDTVTFRDIAAGMYVLQLFYDQKVETVKLIKR